MMNRTTIPTLPKCDICYALTGRRVPARYDTYLLTYNTWACVCEPHFEQHGPRLQHQSQLVTMLVTEEETS